MTIRLEYCKKRSTARVSMDELPKSAFTLYNLSTKCQTSVFNFDRLFSHFLPVPTCKIEI